MKSNTVYPTSASGGDDLPPAPAKSEVTPWFPRGVQPIRKGVYQRLYSGSIAYSRWDGEQWLQGSYEFDTAQRARLKTWQPALPWRGLASNPASKP